MHAHPRAAHLQGVWGCAPLLPLAAFPTCDCTLGGAYPLSLQNVFSTVFCIECVLYRMCACVRCADCILGGAHPHHIYSILCPTESCRQNAFCTECVLYRMCSVQNVIAFWEGRTHTIFIHCCVPQRASTECVLYRTLYVCARHTILIHCCVPQRAAGGNALRQ